jgi:hypothetical protein
MIKAKKQKFETKFSYFFVLSNGINKNLRFSLKLSFDTYANICENLPSGKLPNIKSRKEKIKLTKLKYFVRNLPIQIVKLIWSEYVKPELIYLQFNNILKSKNSKSLDYHQLSNYLNIVLNNQIVLEYLIKNNGAFRKFYIEHFIKNKKHFVLIPDKTSSMALCLLMCLHH